MLAGSVQFGEKMNSIHEKQPTRMDVCCTDALLLTVFPSIPSPPLPLAPCASSLAHSAYGVLS